MTVEAPRTAQIRGGGIAPRRARPGGRVRNQEPPNNRGRDGVAGERFERAGFEPIGSGALGVVQTLHRHSASIIERDRKTRAEQTVQPICLGVAKDLLQGLAHVAPLA